MDRVTPSKYLFPVLALADLAVDAAVLTIAGTVAWTWVVVGASLIPAIGIGLAVLAALVYGLRAYGAVERRRAAAVFGVEILPVPRRRTTRTGAAGFFSQWLLDGTDSAPWRGLGFLAASSALCLVAATVVFGSLGLGIALLLAPVFRPEGGAAGWDVLSAVPVWLLPLLGVLLLVVGLAAATGYGLADRAMARGILGRSAAEALRAEVAAMAQRRSGAVAAAASDRQRIERDLHDGVQPRLVSVAMTLGMARNKLDSDPDGARALLDSAHAEAKEAIVELRQLARGIHPAVLVDRGLDAALSALAARCPVPTALDVRLEARCSSEAEAVVYFAVAEALTNVAKHSRASRCSVQVRLEDGVLTAVVTDDGVGGAVLAAPAESTGLGSTGLSGLRDRAIAAGGQVRLSSPPGGPTSIWVEVPCAS